MENNQTVIKVKGLYKSFETGGRYTNVLRNVNLEISQGEFVIIFGPSGCGKSTLLHVIMGLETPDSGSISMSGMNLWSINAEDRANIRKREIGIMYQQQNWIKSLSVEENIAFSGQLIGMEKTEAIIKAKEALTVAGMNARTEYVPSELSAGEQQKIGLARALVANPKVIIADEPTGNLDVRSGQDMMNLFIKLRESKKTIIMVTHNPEYLKYADRVLLMLDGKVKREISVKEQDSESIQKEISQDLKKFIETGSSEEVEEVTKIPTPIHTVEQGKKRNIYQSFVYAISFNLRFLLQTLLFIIITISQFLEKRFKFLGIETSYVRDKLALFCRAIDKNKRGYISSSINTFDLTEISFKNLQVKRSRTLITVAGMAIGIGFIVFLLSIGYGLERLVINEITKIQDLRQVDIMPTISSNIVLDENNVKIISKTSGVEEVMPLVNLAARVEYERSNTDVVVYGIEGKYLQRSRTTILSGTIFEEDESGVVLNKEFISTLGISADEAVGKEIDIDFVVSGIQETVVDEDQEIAPVVTKYTYTIIGVVDDRNPAVVYVPIMEMEKLGVTEFSQLRIVIENDNVISDVRRQIESLGFETSSVMDTVSDVENMFQYTKLGLVLVGGFALCIAVLGMVNTLTVSLLERTREVGLMKTIGMKSDEISSLFINESMLISISGGALGVFFGLSIGFFISIILSIFSISKGGDFIYVNFLPLGIVISIIIVSSFVGFLTGLYPSKRAVKMAALDALRYE